VDASHILVVSDDTTIQEQARFGFPSSVEVELANDAREAWAIVQDLTPDLVVVDLQTGSAGGYALARDMVAVERLKRVPILVLLQREQDGWLATKAGATAHRVKPLGAAELVRASLALLGDRTSP
jgi:DNA-binding response OmpR family regulator